MIFLYSILGLFAAFLIWFLLVSRGAMLSKETKQKIKSIQKTTIPELLVGKTATLKNGEVSIFYEVLGERNTKGDILLINGHSHSLLTWPKYFYQAFLDEGYRVIRFDNRGLGNSTWIEDWSKENGYTLEDMATDAVAVLDHLKIAQAHIIGMSMGGMISQRIAINYPKRVLSLTSIMSTGYYHDKAAKNTSLQFYLHLARIMLNYGQVLKTEQDKVKLHLAIQQILKGQGDYPFDAERHILDAYYEIRNRKGFNGKVGAQHSAAIEKSGSRLEELSKITAPSLVIHGTTDPLILIGQAKKYAPLIKGAKTLFIEGMGHDLPALHMNEILPKVFENFEHATNH